MGTLTSQIENHYYRPDLYDDILNRLKEMGVDIENVNRKDIASVDEFHVRGAEVSRELAKTVSVNNAKLLDVGCGIGGPCRMLADEFNCKTIGLDLSEEFIKTATNLSKLVGLNNSTEFIQGDATNLPFENKSFDVVWTQHVQMNINDKLKFYSEIDRVLTTKGTFIYYDIFKKGDNEVDYPMPWANESKISFLEQTSKMESILDTLGLQKERSSDQTANGIIFFENLLKKITQFGPPKLGLNVLMGASTKDKITNLLRGLKEEKIMLQSGVYKK
ncbi:class I SAM-dependent methyltransferase [Aquimarina macrocephali]|uniref:class I SAM-dependent methyltransferase n=1 Tax=Aquimarina macrocephali TaxID=666563 RepID=UPI0004638E39|nr:class I SAM-dependent methyltransferase [Aquimarina macrocephali]